MKKAIVWILIVAALGGGYFFYRYKSAKKADLQPTYESVTVEMRDLRTVVESTGEIRPRNRLEVKPPIAGRLEKLPVDEGDLVEKGQIIGWISSTERATLLDAALATSAEEMEYWEDLYKPSPLISPLKGTIIARNFEPGQSIAANDAVVVIADDLIVVANLDETDIGLVKLGQKVNVQLDAYPEDEFLCETEKIAYDSELVSNVTMYEVDVRPHNLPSVARSGMTANLEFVIEEKTGVLAVVSSAILQGNSRAPGGEMGGSYVFVHSEDPENPAQKMVRIGSSDGSHTEILGGLAEGDEVLIQKINVGARDSSRGNSPFSPTMGRGRR